MKLWEYRTTNRQGVAECRHGWGQMRDDRPCPECEKDRLGGMEFDSTYHAHDAEWDALVRFCEARGIDLRPAAQALEFML